MQSLRIDTSDYYAGALVVGDVGLGVLGNNIPSAGDNGPGYAYNSLSLPADANSEIRGAITTWPTHGTLFANEDTSFVYTSTDNVFDRFYWQLYVNGAAVGSPVAVSLYPSGINSTDANAAGALSTLTLTAPTGLAKMDALASGALPSINLNAPAGVASTGTGPAVALGALPSLSLTAPTGYAVFDALASGALTTLTLVALTGSATANDIDVTASGSLPSMYFTAPTGIAGLWQHVINDATTMHAAPRVRTFAAGYTTIMQPSYMSINRYMPPKRTNETEFYGVDFSSLLAENETILTGSVSVQVSRGIDNAPQTMLSGSALINGSIVSQQVTGGIDGVLYALVFTITTSIGNTLQDVKLLQVSDVLN